MMLTRDGIQDKSHPVFTSDISSSCYLAEILVTSWSGRDPFESVKHGKNRLHGVKLLGNGCYLSFNLNDESVSRFNGY